MILFLRTWILNIATVIIFITLLEILLPNSSIKKYINLIIGLLVMLVILNPVLEVINGKVKIENEIIKTSSMIDKKTLSNNMDQFEEVQNEQFIALYKEKLKKNIKDRIEYTDKRKVERIELSVEETKSSDDFGKIEKLNVFLVEEIESKEDKKGIKAVSNIVVNVGLKEEKTDTGMKKEENTYKIEMIRDDISDLYDLDKEKIHVYNVDDH